MGRYAEDTVMLRTCGDEESRYAFMFKLEVLLCKTARKRKIKCPDDAVHCAVTISHKGPIGKTIKRAAHIQIWSIFCFFLYFKEFWNSFRTGFWYVQHWG